MRDKNFLNGYAVSRILMIVTLLQEALDWNSWNLAEECVKHNHMYLFQHWNIYSAICVSVLWDNYVQLDCILILLSNIEVIVVNIAAPFTPVKGTVTIVLNILGSFFSYCL